MSISITKFLKLFVGGLVAGLIIGGLLIWAIGIMLPDQEIRSVYQLKNGLINYTKHTQNTSTTATGTGTFPTDTDEKTDNLTPPQQLTEQQFNASMEEYLTKYTDARFVFGEFSPDTKE